MSRAYTDVRLSIARTKLPRNAAIDPRAKIEDGMLAIGKLANAKPMMKDESVVTPSAMFAAPPVFG